MKRGRPELHRVYWYIRCRSAALLIVMGLAAACALPPGKVRLPPSPAPAERLSQTGIASWYGPGFHGKPTANGEIYNQHDLTAAHQTLPLGSRVAVTNLENGSSTEVVINDRGPFAKGRIIDLSYAAAQAIQMIGPGTALVRVDVLDAPTQLTAIPVALDYTLQLGSFAELNKAQQLRQRLAERFAEVRITPVRSRDMTYYRVQLGSFSNRLEAEARARQLAEAGYDVLVLEK
jgi:rare lipoprotein A